MGAGKLGLAPLPPLDLEPHPELCVLPLLSVHQRLQPLRDGVAFALHPGGAGPELGIGPPVLLMSSDAVASTLL